MVPLQKTPNQKERVSNSKKDSILQLMGWSLFRMLSGWFQALQKSLGVFLIYNCTSDIGETRSFPVGFIVLDVGDIK